MGATLSSAFPLSLRQSVALTVSQSHSQSQSQSLAMTVSETVSLSLARLTIAQLPSVAQETGRICLLSARLTVFPLFFSPFLAGFLGRKRRPEKKRKRTQLAQSSSPLSQLRENRPERVAPKLQWSFGVATHWRKPVGLCS